MIQMTEIQFFNAQPYFTADEIRCPCGECTLPVNDPEFRDFMAIAHDLRREANFPFIVNSGYRCPFYNDSLYVKLGEERGEHLGGPHTIIALDVKVSFERAYRLAKLAFARDLGVGIHQRGLVAGRYVHVDNQGSRLWTY